MHEVADGAFPRRGTRGSRRSRRSSSPRSSSPRADLLAGPDRDRRLHHEDRALVRARAARRSPSRPARGRHRRSASAACRRRRRGTRSGELVGVERERDPLARSARAAPARPPRGTAPRPRSSASTFSATTSRTTTSWPSSAKQAPVTRPTQPAPKMPTRAMPSDSTLPAASGLRPFAIAIIVSLESESSSVFTTQ